MIPFTVSSTKASGAKRSISLVFNNLVFSTTQVTRVVQNRMVQTPASASQLVRGQDLDLGSEGDQEVWNQC